MIKNSISQLQEHKWESNEWVNHLLEPVQWIIQTNWLTKWIPPTLFKNNLGDFLECLIIVSAYSFESCAQYNVT